MLDCDHVPTRDFLTRTVEYFLADPKLFLVQTPHFFINPTPIEKGLAGMGNPNGENDMFYKEIHRSLDFWNSSYFCGSAALLRRTCLEEVGGISGKTITEDAETAFKLHSRGYNSAYMDRPMICGLSPESYDDYVLQRTRWAQGMTQLLVMNNPLLTPGLSLHQRLCYFNSCFFWLFGFARFTYFIAPACFLILGLNIYHASLPQIVSIVLPYVLSTFIVMDFFYGRARQPFFSEIYECVQAMFLIPAVISVFLNPHKPSFKVTPKGQKMDSDFLNPLAVIFFIIILVNLVAVGMGVVKWFTFPILHDTLIITGVWCSYNLFLALVSIGAFWERRQIRHHHRVNVSEPVKVSLPRLGLEVEGKVTDLSLTGLAFQINLPLPPISQERVMLEVGDSYGNRYQFEAKLQRISHRANVYNCGSEFLLDDKKYAEAVAYMYGDSERWLGMWLAKSRSGGTLRMLRHFVRMGFKGARLCATMFWEMARTYWQRIRENGLIMTLRRTLGTA
jgi:cellulose synthase (UDP-forming)